MYKVYLERELARTRQRELEQVSKLKKSIEDAVQEALAKERQPIAQPVIEQPAKLMLPSKPTAPVPQKLFAASEQIAEDVKANMSTLVSVNEKIGSLINALNKNDYANAHALTIGIVTELGRMALLQRSFLMVATDVIMYLSMKTGKSVNDLTAPPPGMSNQVTITLEQLRYLIPERFNCADIRSSISYKNRLNDVDYQMLARDLTMLSDRVDLAPVKEFFEKVRELLTLVGLKC